MLHVSGIWEIVVALIIVGLLIRYPRAMYVLSFIIVVAAWEWWTGKRIDD